MKVFIEVVTADGAQLLNASSIVSVASSGNGSVIHVNALNQDGTQLIVETKQSYLSIVEQIKTALS